MKKTTVSLAFLVAILSLSPLTQHSEHEQSEPTPDMPTLSFEDMEASLVSYYKGASRANFAEDLAALQSWAYWQKADLSGKTDTGFGTAVAKIEAAIDQ